MTETGVEDDAWGYLIVCVPIVVIFAPLGSIISSHFHRCGLPLALVGVTRASWACSVLVFILCTLFVV